MKTAGESTRAMARERRRRIHLFVYTGVGVAVLGLGVIFWLMTYNWKMSAAFGIAGSLILMTAMIGVFLGIKYAMDRASGSLEILKEEEKRALRGADGEVVVGRFLEQIASGRHLLFHDVRTPAGNIDHVLLSERGQIYLVETKAHSGVVSVDNGVVNVNGRRPEKDFIRQIWDNVFWLKAELDRVTGERTWVKPVLVFANAYVPRNCRVKNIVIINEGYLDGTLAWLDRERPRVNLWLHRDKIEHLLRDAPRT